MAQDFLKSINSPPGGFLDYDYYYYCYSCCCYLKEPLVVLIMLTLARWLVTLADWCSARWIFSLCLVAVVAEMCDCASLVVLCASFLKYFCSMRFCLSFSFSRYLMPLWSVGMGVRLWLEATSVAESKLWLAVALSMPLSWDCRGTRC